MDYFHALSTCPTSRNHAGSNLELCRPQSPDYCSVNKNILLATHTIVCGMNCHTILLDKERMKERKNEVKKNGRKEERKEGRKEGTKK
jgi:hypothetical protein